MELCPAAVFEGPQQAKVHSVSVRPRGQFAEGHGHEARSFRDLRQMPGVNAWLDARCAVVMNAVWLGIWRGRERLTTLDRGGEQCRRER
jgi:hypothetical protein